MVNRVLIILLLSIITGYSAEYFVDPINGLDSNTGTATNTAWQHGPGDTLATGNPNVVSLSPGDIVSYLGGSTNYAYISTDATWDGTAGSPIIFRSHPTWGTGRAIIDGTSGGVTNATGINCRGSYNIITGFEVRNSYNNGIRLYDGTPNNTVVSNNYVHHIGYYPWVNGVGDGITINNCSNPIVVSNEVFDVSRYLLGGNNQLTNVTLFGNHVYSGQVDAINMWAYGYFLINGNTIHDCTNIVTHGDAMQILAAPDLTVVANNIVYDCTQLLYFNPYADPLDSNELTAGLNYLVVTNSTHPTTAAFWHDGVRYPLGSEFTAVTTSGSWEGGAGVLMWNKRTGTILRVNNVIYRTVGKVGAGSGGNGIDTFVQGYTNYWWNNTADSVSIGWFGGLRHAWCGVTNNIIVNNLFLGELTGSLSGLSGFPTNAITPTCSFITGYNLFTMNDPLPISAGSRGTLVQFNAIYPTNEINSVQDTTKGVRDRLGRDYTLTNYLKYGTNLSAIVANIEAYPEWTNIPAIYRPNLAADRLGNLHGDDWGVGAYELDLAAPSLSLTPVNGSKNVTGSIIFNATFVGGSGNVTNLVWYTNGVAAATNTASPWTMTKTLTSGQYTNYAYAETDDNTNVWSGTNIFTVAVPPSGWLDPIANFYVGVSKTLTINATASVDAPLTNVYYVANSVSIGSNTVAPYSLVYNFPVGLYSVHAILQDTNFNISTTNISFYSFAIVSNLAPVRLRIQ